MTFANNASGNGLADRPSVIVFGIGHSGTSIITGMLFELGWERNDADAAFNESVSMRALNDKLIDGEPCDADMGPALGALRRPFAIKDPRFVVTIAKWRPLFSRIEPPPFLLYLTREASAVRSSYLARQELNTGDASVFNHTLEELEGLAVAAYVSWPFGKIRLSYEQIRSAVSLFRLVPGESNPSGGLWR